MKRDFCSGLGFRCPRLPNLCLQLETRNATRDQSPIDYAPWQAQSKPELRLKIGNEREKTMDPDFDDDDLINDYIGESFDDEPPPPPSRPAGAAPSSNNMEVDEYDEEFLEEMMAAEQQQLQVQQMPQDNSNHDNHERYNNNNVLSTENRAVAGGNHDEDDAEERRSLAALDSPRSGAAVRAEFARARSQQQERQDVFSFER